MKTITEERKDYMKRLIKGIRYMMAKDPETIKAKEDCGEEVTIGRWLDADLLCVVVEKEVLGINDNDSKEGLQGE